MKRLGVVAGLLVASACSGEPADDLQAGEGAEAVRSFEMLRGHGHDDHDQGHGGNARQVRRALGAAAARLAQLQADTIGDSARNGLVDVDPDDGGWDFIISPSATEHTAAASPPNLYGAIGMAAWAALATDSAGTRALVMALDAGVAMQRNPDIDSAPDFVFAVLLAELADNPGFAAVARAHYDAKLAAAGGAAGLGARIRDDRHRGNNDGLIPYDVGWFVLAAAALDAAFPGRGYDADADAFAQVVVDDLGAAAPLFDLADPREGFYVTGLAWAQVPASWLGARTLFARARARLLAEQHTNGAWGTNATAPADDLQATAHALQTLALTDRATRDTRGAIRRGARWLLGGQAASGGWPDAQNNELPLVDADIALGLMLSRTREGADGVIPDGPDGAALGRDRGNRPTDAPRAAPVP